MSLKTYMLRLEGYETSSLYGPFTSVTIEGDAIVVNSHAVFAQLEDCGSWRMHADYPANDDDGDVLWDRIVVY